ncbi:hypothetical protein CMI37_34855 [Candidatus Pacearchaeota archaeon]|nr:hypothetical protein [Candidatus Pacearchaeota archaeon]
MYWQVYLAIQRFLASLGVVVAKDPRKELVERYSTAMKKRAEVQESIVDVDRDIQESLRMMERAIDETECWVLGDWAYMKDIVSKRVTRKRVVVLD